MRPPQIVTIDIKGEVHTGTYTVLKGMLTVTSPIGSKPPVKLGAMPARRLAKILLADLVIEERARRRRGGPANP
jgi:hypothetical protein